MTLTSEQINKMKQSIDNGNTPSFTSTPTFTVPTFDPIEKFPPINPISLSEAFDVPEKKETDIPF
jgi:hypothetical protein